MKVILIFRFTLILAIAAQAQIAPGVADIAFMRGEYICVRDAQTGRIRRIARGFDPHLSSDGTQVAFTQSLKTDDPNRKIRIVELVTGKTRDLLPGITYTHYGAQWSPDGTRIAAHIFFHGGISSRWVMAIVDLATGKWTHCLGGNGESVFLSSWTPDSQSVIGHDLRQIYQADLNGKEIRRWQAADVAGEEADIDSGTRFILSPDGMRILFDASTTTAQDYDGESVRVLFMFDTATKTRKRITPTTLHAVYPAWSATDDEITFTGYSARSRRARPNFYRINPTATKPVVVLADANHASLAAADAQSM